MTLALNDLASLANSDKIAMLEVPDVVTVDTEGVTSMMGLSVAFDGLTQGMYLPFDHAVGNMTEKEKDHVLQLLAKKTIVHHHAIHDVGVLRRAGLTARYPFYCTLLMCHWINEELLNYSLDHQSKINGGLPKEMPEVMKSVIDSDGWHAVPVPWMDEYSSNDAYITHQLFRKKLPEFQAQGFDGELWDREQEFIRDVMGPMIELGVKVDVAYSIREYMRGQGIMEECLKELGFKPTSPVALEKFLIQELGLPVVKHTKACLKCYPKDRRLQSQSIDSHHAKASFDKDAMKEYDFMLDKKNDDRAQTILRYRGWLKTNSSNYKPYMTLVDENHVLHPGYKLHGTKTGRLSCADPNLQQIPKSSDKDWNGELKKAFVARDGFGLWTIDYSQLQFRMTVAYACAYASQFMTLTEIPEYKLVETFNDPTRDTFTEMAKDMSWLRDDVKTLTYLILFGGGGKRASVAFAVPVSQGKELVEEFYSEYPNIRKVSDQAQKEARKQGYVTYWTGRRRHFGRGSAYYRAFNAAIQGGEAEIMKRAMIAVQKEVCAPSNGECRMVLQIHDEIAFEIAIGKEEYYLAKAQEVMERVPQDFCKYVGIDIAFRTSAGEWGKK